MGGRVRWHGSLPHLLGLHRSQRCRTQVRNHLIAQGGCRSGGLKPLAALVASASTAPGFPVVVHVGVQMDHHCRHRPERCANTGRKRHGAMPVANAEREKENPFSTLHTLADKFVFVVQIESTGLRGKEL